VVKVEGLSPITFTYESISFDVSTLTFLDPTGSLVTQTITMNIE
jgi:hypothetical protein